MKNVPENELFSAYLDGELTADEQAEVERLLAASPATRQLVEELRALTASLQALPSHKIGEDISGQVLRRAERRMLSDPATARPGTPEASQPEAPRWRAILRRVARPRNFAWSGVAVAVALLLMLMESGRLQQSQDRPIAMQTPAAREESARKESEAAPSMVPSIGASREVAEAMPAEDADAFAESPAAATGPAKGPTVGYRSRQAGYGYGVASGVAGGVEAAGKRDRVADAPARREPALKGRPSVAPEKPERADVAALPESVAATMPGQPRPDLQQAERPLVVWYNVTAEAVRDRVFEALLGKQQITRAEVVERRGARGTAVNGQVHDDALELYSVAAAPTKVIQVDVEATREQLRGLLADLTGRPEQFTLLSYPSPAGSGAPGFQGLEGPRQMPVPDSAGAPIEEAVQAVTEDAGAAVQKKADRVEPSKAHELGRALKLADQVRQQAGPGEPAGPQPFGPAMQPPVQLELPSPPAEAPAAPAPPADESKAAERQAAEPAPEEPKAQEAEELRAAEPLTEGAGGQAPPRLPRKHEQKPKAGPGGAGQPALPVPTEESDQNVRKYVVRFVFQVVIPEHPNVAASVAKESARADVASEAAAPAAVEAMAAPPAEPAAAAGVEP